VGTRSRVKPPPFEYEAPTDIDATLSLLQEHAADAKVLAGGQSLVPLLNFRLAAPARLIDINGVGELAYIRQRDGVLHVGALTRQATVERSSMIATRWPILREALAVVAHPQIRNRGTIGGSVAHADPAAELPAVFAALDARLHVRSSRGSRTLGWREFFVTELTTALEPDELLVEVEVPAGSPCTGMALVEFARRHGDFALGGAAVTVTLDEDRHCSHAAIALLAAGPTPLRCDRAEAALVGRHRDDAVIAEAAALAVDGIDPAGDIHGSARYRRRLIQSLVRRAVTRAWVRAERTGLPETI
jgi:CO/xanthine dehydrogenase FAD-binding subunit